MRERKPVQFKEIVVQEEDLLWHVLPFFFVPEGNVEERVKKDKVPYDVWVREGWITATKGNAIDQQAIRSVVNECRGKFEIVDIGFDSWNASQMANELIEDGLTLMEVRQGYKTMSEPMKQLMALVLSKLLEHYGNPVLTWNAGNTAAESDPTGSIKPNKEKSKEKIDGIVATLMAIHRVVSTPAIKSSAYSERGIIFL